MELKKENATLRYFVTLRCEGAFPSGFDTDTWEITERAYDALRSTVKTFETADLHAVSTIRNSRAGPLKRGGNGDRG